MTAKDYAKDLVRDYVLNPPMSTLELEMRLDNLILLSQNEGMMNLTSRFNTEVIGDFLTEPTNQ